MDSSGVTLNQCFPSYDDKGVAQGSQQAILLNNNDGTYTVAMFYYPTGTTCTAGSSSMGSYTGDSTSGCVSAGGTAPGRCMSQTVYLQGGNSPMTVWTRCALTNAPVPSRGPSNAPTAGATYAPKPSPPPGVIDLSFTYGNRTIYSDSQCTCV